MTFIAGGKYNKELNYSLPFPFNCLFVTICYVMAVFVFLAQTVIESKLSIYFSNKQCS